MSCGPFVNELAGARAVPQVVARDVGPARGRRCRPAHRQAFIGRAQEGRSRRRIRRLVLVGDRNGDLDGGAGALSVLHRHRDRVARLCLVVERALGAELPAGRVDVERIRIRALETVGQGVARIGVRGRHRVSDVVPCRGVLGHAARVVVGVERRRLVLVGDRNGDLDGGAGALSVLHRHRDRVARLCLVVERALGAELPAGRVDVERRRIRSPQTVGQGVARIGVRGRHRVSDGLPGLGVLGHAARVVVGVERRRLVRVRHRNGDLDGGAGALTVFRHHRHRVARLCLVVERGPGAELPIGLESMSNASASVPPRL